MEVWDSSRDGSNAAVLTSKRKGKAMGTMLRRVLAVVVVCALGLAIVLPMAGCGEKEPTAGDQIDRTVDAVGDAAADAADDAAEAAE